jgi:hypothetical protein
VQVCRSDRRVPGADSDLVQVRCDIADGVKSGNGRPLISVNCQTANRIVGGSNACCKFRPYIAAQDRIKRIENHFVTACKRCRDGLISLYDGFDR